MWNTVKRVRIWKRKNGACYTFSQWHEVRRDGVSRERKPLRKERSWSEPAGRAWCVLWKVCGCRKEGHRVRRDDLLSSSASGPTTHTPTRPHKSPNRTSIVRLFTSFLELNRNLLARLVIGANILTGDSLFSRRFLLGFVCLSKCLVYNFDCLSKIKSWVSVSCKFCRRN